MNENLVGSAKITVFPELVLPGGTAVIESDQRLFDTESVACRIGSTDLRMSAIRPTRLVVQLPDTIETGVQVIDISQNDMNLVSKELVIGERVCSGMHIVANPAIDPVNGALIVTKSGSRGHQLAQTLFRVDEFGTSDLDVEVLNPTGIAFDENGILYVTNRAEGAVVRIDRDETSMNMASDLGVATGIAFSPDGVMYVGDRGGTIFRISSLGDAREFATVNSSVSAYHLAFDLTGDLYVSAPGLCSFDSIFRIDPEGRVSEFYKGLGRPQGLAFDQNGNLLVAACLRGRHGVVRIEPDGIEAELVISGTEIVGLCFDKEWNLFVATGDSVFKFESKSLDQ